MKSTTLIALAALLACWLLPPTDARAAVTATTAVYRSNNSSVQVTPVRYYRPYGGYYRSYYRPYGGYYGYRPYVYGAYVSPYALPAYGYGYGYPYSVRSPYYFGYRYPGAGYRGYVARPQPRVYYRYGW